MRSGEACCICSQIAGDPENDLFARLLSTDLYSRRVAMETRYFAAIPSLGPLVVGHTLLCPRAHFESFAALPCAYEAEYENVKARLAMILRSTFRAPVHFFEHGMCASGTRVLCSVDHAHLHFVPADIDVWEKLTRRLKVIEVGPRLADIQNGAGAGEYIFYEAPNGERVIIRDLDGMFESQFMRKIFAEAMDLTDHWDWRQNPKPAMAIETLQRILSEMGR